MAAELTREETHLQVQEGSWPIKVGCLLLERGRDSGGVCKDAIGISQAGTAGDPLTEGRGWQGNRPSRARSWPPHPLPVVLDDYPAPDDTFWTARTDMRSIWTDEEMNPNEVLWRYFRADRLASALESRCLHFPSARQFEDQFEGAVAVLAHDFPSDPRYPDFGFGDKAFEELRRLTKISCWHRSDYESAAMWKLYAAEGKGIAVRTTPRRLEAALRPFRLAPEYSEEEPYWGIVRYRDLHTERLRASMEQRFFYKHRAFESEREFRVIISVRMAEEFGVCVPEEGIDVPFKPEELIESVFLGPALAAADRDAIIGACAGIDARFSTSTLLGRPRYT